MNVNDVTEKIEVPENIWKAIFEKQWELAQKYKDIEGMGDLLDPAVLKNNINTRQGQKWIKDFAWRVTEELAEADEAYYSNELIHYVEELSDALHFLVELSLIANYDYTFVKQNFNHDKGKENSYSNVIYPLGLMCNCLKNKPWKQTEMLTDKNKFEKYLRHAWVGMIQLFKGLDLDEKEI